jgi:hypothetical protein
MQPVAEATENLYYGERGAVDRPVVHANPWISPTLPIDAARDHARPITEGPCRNRREGAPGSPRVLRSLKE